MQARIVRSLSGARWLAEGWRLFRASPFGWLALVFAYWLLMTFISVLPVLGVIAAVVLVPPFAVGFMAASRAAAARRPVELAHLFAGFRERAAQQLALGGVYLACLGLVLAASALADDGTLARVMSGSGRLDTEAVRTGNFLTALLVASALYVPVMMAFWFAPVLAAWHAVSVPKALFFSVAACLMNWRAFFAYGVVTAAVMVLVPFIVLSVVGLLFRDAMRSASGLIVPLVVMLLPTLYASFYASYRDVFAPPEPPAPEAEVTSLH